MSWELIIFARRILRSRVFSRACQHRSQVKCKTIGYTHDLQWRWKDTDSCCTTHDWVWAYWSGILVNFSSCRSRRCANLAYTILQRIWTWCQCTCWIAGILNVASRLIRIFACIDPMTTHAWMIIACKTFYRFSKFLLLTIMFIHIYVVFFCIEIIRYFFFSFSSFFRTLIEWLSFFIHIINFIIYWII